MPEFESRLRTKGIQMAAITWDNVVSIAAELADPAVSADAQTAILGYVNSALDESKFAPYALYLARVNLAAHLATVTAAGTGDATLGAVLSESVGGITRTYEAIGSASAGDNLDESSYGTAFKFFVRTSRARLPFVAGC